MKITPIEKSITHAIYLAWVSGNYTLKQLADTYNVSEATVSNIVSRKLRKRGNN